MMAQRSECAANKAGEALTITGIGHSEFRPTFRLQVRFGQGYYLWARSTVVHSGTRPKQTRETPDAMAADTTQGNSTGFSPTNAFSGKTRTYPRDTSFDQKQSGRNSATLMAVPLRPEPRPDATDAVHFPHS